MELLEAIIPNDILTNIDQGREEELIQHLTDLGYLSLSLSYENKKLVLGKALSDFRTEAFEAGISSSLPLPSFNDDSLVAASEMELLNRLVSFDCDFNIHWSSIPKPHRINLRVLHYRLKMLGIYAGKVENEYGIETEDALFLFAIWLQIRVYDAPFSQRLELGFKNKLINPSDQKSFEQLINLTGDINEIEKIISGNTNLKKRILYFTSSESSQDNTEIDFTQLSLVNGKFVSPSLPNRFWKKNTDDPQILAKRKTLQNYNEIDVRISLYENIAALHLVQLHLWTKGFYHGFIDGRMGVETIQAMKDFCSYADLKWEDLVADIGKRRSALNTELFFTEANKLVGSHVDTEGSDVMYNDEYNIEELKKVLDDKATTERKENLFEKLFTDEWKSTMQQMSLGKRIYFGFRSLVRMALNGLRKVIDVIRDFFNKLKDAARNFAKLLFREIREALKVFGEGYKFLLGKREVSTSYADTNGNAVVLTTDFDADFDMVNLFPANADPKQLQLHSLKCLNKSKNLFFTLSYTGTALHYIIQLASGAGWAKILIEISLKFKELIKEKINSQRLLK